MSLPGIPFMPGLSLCGCHGHGLCPDVDWPPEALEHVRSMLTPMTPEERAAFMRDIEIGADVSEDDELAFLRGEGPDPWRRRTGADLEHVIA